MLLEAASWQGSSHSLRLLLDGRGTRSAPRFENLQTGRQPHLLNFSLVLSLQGSSELSAGAGILMADAVHLAGLPEIWKTRLKKV